VLVHKRFSTQFISSNDFVHNSLVQKPNYTTQKYTNDPVHKHQYRQFTSTRVYCTVLYCTVLYCTVLYCTVLYCTVLYCTVLYCTVLYCTLLYCTVSSFMFTFLSSKLFYFRIVESS